MPQVWEDVDMDGLLDVGRKKAFKQGKNWWLQAAIRPFYLFLDQAACITELNRHNVSS